MRRDTTIIITDIIKIINAHSYIPKSILLLFRLTTIILPPPPVIVKGFDFS
nr:MAG TPA: hypothetical protein [Bacteriophage sp.]